VSAPRVSPEEARRFLEARCGAVETMEPLGGGFWSTAYGFKSAGRELVARFGADRSWFEADRSAMAFASPDLPVPDVLEIGDGPGGAYAVSIRHHGSYLEAVRPEQSARSAPMLTRLLEALFLVPKSGDLLVGWHWQPARPEVGWRAWLLESLVNDRERGSLAKLASDPALERLFREAESRIKDLAADCPERRDLVHGDLLHANVLVGEDASQVNAVFSWKCSVRGDFLYDVAWCSFWGGIHPGVAAADPWGGVFTSEVIAADTDALIGAADRHHCYELQIGAIHLGWNIWVGDDAALAETAHLLAAVLERGPLSAR